MLKYLYDTDCVTWSPQGKLFQVEYAMEAVKQGSICLGLKSKDFVVHQHNFNFRCFVVSNVNPLSWLGSRRSNSRSMTISAYRLQG